MSSYSGPDITAISESTLADNNEVYKVFSLVNLDITIFTPACPVEARIIRGNFYLFWLKSIWIFKYQNIACPCRVYES